MTLCPLQKFHSLGWQPGLLQEHGTFGWRPLVVPGCIAAILSWLQFQNWVHRHWQGLLLQPQQRESRRRAQSTAMSLASARDTHSVHKTRETHKMILGPRVHWHFSGSLRKWHWSYDYKNLDPRIKLPGKQLGSAQSKFHGVKSCFCIQSSAKKQSKFAKPTCPDGSTGQISKANLPKAMAAYSPVSGDSSLSPELD